MARIKDVSKVTLTVKHPVVNLQEAFKDERAPALLV